MISRCGSQYLEGRAQEAFERAKSTQDRPTRSIYLKTAKCYHDLARAIEERERIRVTVTTPGRTQ